MFQSTGLPSTEICADIKLENKKSTNSKITLLIPFPLGSFEYSFAWRFFPEKSKFKFPALPLVDTNSLQQENFKNCRNVLFFIM